MCVCVGRSVVTSSLWPHGLQPIRGISQARILEWVAIPSSKGSFQPWAWTWVSCIAGSAFFTAEPPGKPNCYVTVIKIMINYLPSMWETQVRSLNREDPLEKELETHSSILAWRGPRSEEPGRLQSTGSQKVGHNWVTEQQNQHINHITESLEDVYGIGWTNSVLKACTLNI